VDGLAQIAASVMVYVCVRFED